MQLGLGDRVLETALPSIINIVIGHDHKLLTIFDSELTVLLQYFVPEISCGYDPLVLSCSVLYMNEGVECSSNAVWNMAEKKCYCVGGYFLDVNQRTCKKCQCTDSGHYC
jgi:hypothetical protein